MKDTKQLIIEFVDNCKESFQRLENLIRLNEDGLMKCFEWSENLEKEMTIMRYMEQNLRDACKRIEELEVHISKVHDLVNLEDRITASDVLCRLTLLENQCKNGYQYQKDGIDVLKKRIESLEFHKNLQIDENRKISKRMDELDENILEARIQFIGKLANDKKPYMCPVCHGNGKWQVGSIEDTIRNDNKKFMTCKSCEGKGILWS